MRVTADTKAATRQRIVAAAQKLFYEQGFEAATTRDIARAAQIAVGTLFDDFPTKESLALCLVSEAHAQAEEHFRPGLSRDSIEPRTFEEDLFAHVATALRKLKPFRNYLTAVLETSLSPLTCGRDDGASALRVDHLETVSKIAMRHGQEESLSNVALHLYWTLYTGVLAFWSRDDSPRQEDTLALLDQSLAMFVGWLTSHSKPTEPQEKRG